MKAILVLLFLVSFGFGKIQLERAVLPPSSVSSSLQPVLDPTERIGQTALVGILGGFRAVVADLLFIDGFFAWERTDWSHLLMRLRQVTMLQPHMLMFWDVAAWHMAWNASTAALNDTTKSPALRQRAQYEYFELGRDFLERGIASNPQRPELYEALARLYRDKYQDHARAAENFAAAARLPESAAYDERFAAYELASCPGREREAYDRLHALYLRGERERLPTLLRRLRALEQQLDIPAPERIPSVVKR